MWAVILRSKMPTRGQRPRNGVQAPACRLALLRYRFVFSELISVVPKHLKHLCFSCFHLPILVMLRGNYNYHFLFLGSRCFVIALFFRTYFDFFRNTEIGGK